MNKHKTPAYSRTPTLAPFTLLYSYKVH